MSNYKIIVNRDESNRDYYGEEAFQKVCEATGTFLDDQTEENLQFFEYLVDNMPLEIFDQDLELLENGEPYLMSANFIVTALNNDLVHYCSLNDFLTEYFKNTYGEKGYWVYELLYESLANNLDSAVEDVINLEGLLIDRYNDEYVCNYTHDLGGFEKSLIFLTNDSYIEW